VDYAVSDRFIDHVTIMSNPFFLDHFESCVHAGQTDEAIDRLCALNLQYVEFPSTDPLSLMARPPVWPPLSN
jgi:hypothetical protein